MATDSGWRSDWAPAAPTAQRAERAAATEPAPPDPYPSPAQPAAPHQPAERRQLSDLSSTDLLRPRRAVPTRGWRRMMYAATRGAVNPGPSEAEARREELLTRVRRRVDGCHRIAVISLKGGVGKTTTVAGLGAVLASVRGDRVVALDGNPDMGTLAARFPRQTELTVRDLLLRAPRIRRYSDVRIFTSQDTSRLEVIASEEDPAVSLAFDEEDYRRVVGVLSDYYTLVITDSGTGLLHSAMRGILGLADSLIVVTSPSVDGARSADATLNWLVAHGHRELAEHSVTVISTVRSGSQEVDVERLTQHFAGRCRSVVRIPYDAHLSAGAEIEIDRLRPATHEAFLTLAAAVADGFGRVEAQAKTAR